MSPLPLISIVSASWNQGKYLQECIDSLKGDYQECIEHIVIDNCSDDETGSILKKHPEICAIVERDTGQSEALNKGFRSARGEWVLWLNVDDFLLPGALSRMIHFLQQEGSYFDMIYGHMVFVDEKSEVIRTIYQPRWYNWMTRIGCFVAPSTGSLFRRSVLIENPLNENFHMIMDTEWMLRTGKTLRVKRLNFRTVSFRIDDNKTADHIQTGAVTPQHRKEREELGALYSSYPRIIDDRSWHPKQLVLKLMRRATRVWVLSDKLFAKFFLVKPRKNPPLSQ